MIKRLLICCGLALLLAGSADAQEKVFAITDASGAVITYYAGEPEIGDEYISRQNKHYVVRSVDASSGTAVAEMLGDYPMPSVEWLSDSELSTAVSATGKAVAIYCTHSDESYEPNDGTHSETPRGSIYDIAEALKGHLEKLGVTVYYDDETHHPHDSGAYRRSRATAEGLLKNRVDAIFDIHRDGIEDPGEYETEIDGEEASMVRLLVGRSNQNSAENKAFAVEIKAVADALYPELIRDIYIGKGSYNQDLSPNAVLMEFGTHTIDKERVTRSTKYMAEAIEKTLYGGVSGAAQSKLSTGDNAQKRDKSAFGSIGLIIGAAAVGAVIFALISTGNGKAAMQKMKDGVREMTGGVTGKKKKD